MRLTKVNSQKVFIDFLSQDIVLVLIYEAFLEHFSQVVSLVPQHNCGCPPGMNFFDHSWKTVLKLTNVCKNQVDILSGFVQDLIQQLVVDWKVYLEDADCLLACLHKNYPNFIQRVNLGNKHPCEERTKDWDILQPAVHMDSFQREGFGHVFKIHQFKFGVVISCVTDLF